MTVSKCNNLHYVSHLTNINFQEETNYKQLMILYRCNQSSVYKYYLSVPHNIISVCLSHCIHDCSLFVSPDCPGILTNCLPACDKQKALMHFRATLAPLLLSA